MPLDCVETATAGPASRKRAYEHITRSASRSVTPTAPPAKRRRTTRSIPRFTSPPRQMSSRNSSPVQAQGQRFVGDGLDYRRPTVSSIAQARQHTTIDLTLDDGEGAEEEHVPTLGRRTARSPSWAPIDRDIDSQSTPRSNTGSHSAAGYDARRQQRRQPYATTQIIDITGEEDIAANDGESSSDVEIVEVRQAPERIMPRHSTTARRTTTPPGLRRANAQSWTTNFPLPQPMVDFLGAARSQGVFGLNPILDTIHRRWRTGFGGPEPLDLTTYDGIDGLDDDDYYNNITMDHGNAAFGLLDPPEDEIIMTDNYKAPSAAKEGFTRDIEEEGDVLVCVACDDELATGDEDDIKAQVWVVRKCGHVYCGECASHRTGHRKTLDRDRTRAKQRKVDDIKVCRVTGCTQKLTGKTAMFQIYL